MLLGKPVRWSNQSIPDPKLRGGSRRSIDFKLVRNDNGTFTATPVKPADENFIPPFFSTFLAAMYGEKSFFELDTFSDGNAANERVKCDCLTQVVAPP